MDVVDAFGSMLLQREKVYKYPIKYELDEERSKFLQLQKQKLDGYRGTYSPFHKQYWTQSFWQKDLFPEFRMQLDQDDPFEPPLTSSENATGCRVVGTYSVEKVAGNLHVMSGL
ncbi:hypothetical protein Ciccas_007383 [Cichlidogyrus casuarinus]|uniref:Uncharacterized protein n=1 Tax=Cichlidogyrus casuarinus TaxID=1844966 RepID=A0ABD2Q325_9PLAT